ncbi:hypothetical protein SK128_025866 [Halocaridina rubra]|uniref:Uncharacterized protein n=1 Tax=Halocaridina rubra TaxID=373956 RepID=A0AAN8WDS9_HALRR
MCVEDDEEKEEEHDEGEEEEEEIEQNLGGGVSLFAVFCNKTISIRIGRGGQRQDRAGELRLDGVEYEFVIFRV